MSPNTSINPNAQPLVSILIPTHNRPDYLPLALQSALDQSYTNIEIVISDNGESEESRELLQPFLQRDARISYHRAPSGRPYMENWMTALHNSHGEYVNFLMDDDLFHPQKIERMLAYYLNYQNIGLVTSFRQLIDDQGREIPSVPTTRRLFETDSIITGASLSDYVLKHGMNVVGEPTTALVRRADIGDRFGMFCGYQYIVLSDLATWLSVTAGRHCVYIAEPLSYFRIHGAQDQRKSGTAIKANVEWLRLLVDGHEQGLCIADAAEFRQMLANKLSLLVPYLASHHQDIMQGEFDVPGIQALISRALGLLLAPAAAQRLAA